MAVSMWGSLFWPTLYTIRHIFLSSMPNFIRFPYSVYEIFNSFKLLSQISVASHSFSLWWLLHLPAGQYPSPPCPWDGCSTVSWDTRLYQPTGLATEQIRSQSGGLCDLGNSARTSLPLWDPTFLSASFQTLPFSDFHQTWKNMWIGESEPNFWNSAH